MNPLKIFGREPAVVLSLIASAIMMFTSFIYPLTGDQQGALNAVAMGLVGIISFWAIAEDGGLALIIGFAKAVLALGLAFGLNLTAEQQAVLMSFVTILAQAVIIRPNVVAPITASGATVTKPKTLD